MTDSIQQRLTSYACDLNYDGLSPKAIHAAKGRVIDTLGALLGGFFGQPVRIVRSLAAQMPDPDGATIIGTRIKTTPDMAAFANAGAPHHEEMQDIYHHCHPSDVVTPVFAVAEHARASGREFVTGIVLAYEIFCRMSDVFQNSAFDYTNVACRGTAVAAAKLLGLSPDQLSHCISMAIVPNVSLRQEKESRLSMWKEIALWTSGPGRRVRRAAGACGDGGSAPAFRRQGGWCDHVSGERFSL